MAKSYKKLRAELEARPDYEAQAAAARERLAAEDEAYLRRLGDLRRARHMTQVEMSRRLRVAQPSLSRMERQADLYVSTLRRCVEAMGGQLEIHAIFPDVDYEIRFDDFEQIDHDNPDLGEELPQAL